MQSIFAVVTVHIPGAMAVPTSQELISSTPPLGRQPLLPKELEGERVWYMVNHLLVHGPVPWNAHDIIERDIINRKHHDQTRTKVITSSCFSNDK